MVSKEEHQKSLNKIRNLESKVQNLQVQLEECKAQIEQGS